MGKLVKKFSVIVACLSLVLGVVGVGQSTVAKASVNSDPLIVQNVYKSNENTVVTAVVKVSKDQYENNHLRMECKNASETKSFNVSITSGTVDLGDGNYATVEYSWDEGYYIITIVLQRNTLPENARACFYSGSLVANNGGYGYFLFS